MEFENNRLENNRLEGLRKGEVSGIEHERFGQGSN